ncbi:MarR family transcriptional regulator [Viridibacillus sp. FSL R5-0477]|uniref:Transcriptional regulator n=1 Tax=Viridibacillus arenosi FSL R5-213 TaxID=1227360 RepID=W4EVG6_9BACL|nr:MULTISPECIES: MarR family transcriptional regulator [Viridibacillus]ETT84244.1 transcriptional regulator [Viridibacillus arenosi FSL R5-213]
MKTIGDKKLETYNLTLEQARFIGYLFQHEDEGISQKDMERAFQRKGSTISSIVHNLEKKGFIERKVDMKDERRRIIHVLPKGKNLVEDFNDFFKEMETTMVNGLDDKEKDALSNMLDKVINNLDYKS